MEIELRFFANFRETVGQKTLTREFEDASTIGDLAESLTEEYPDMDLFQDDGSLRSYVRVLKNGKDVEHIDGLATTVQDGDEISVFPPVAGG